MAYTKQQRPSGTRAVTMGCSCKHLVLTRRQQCTLFWTLLQVSKNPVWFVSLVACEVALQLPFFFVAIYAIIKRRNWFRLPGLVYGVSHRLLTDSLTVDLSVNHHHLVNVFYMQSCRCM